MDDRERLTEKDFEISVRKRCQFKHEIGHIFYDRILPSKSQGYMK